MAAKACGKKSGPRPPNHTPAEADTSSFVAQLTQAQVIQEKWQFAVNGRQWLAQTASRNRTVLRHTSGRRTV